MATALSSLSLLRPGSLHDALHMLRDEGPLTPIAGCTDVYVGLHFGTMPHKRFIDLWRLKELHGISIDRDVLRIGATTTYTEIIASKLVQKRVPMLAAAAGEVGGAQIQNRGTLGGNVANASPAGDTLPVLAAAGELDMPDFRDGAEVLAAQLPDARRVDIAGAGHLAPLEQPDAFRELLLGYLADVSADAG